MNFIASAGILKFYFDKKLAAQKEEADKKIAELSGKIERGNYIHKVQFEKEFNISIPDEQAETITTVGQAVSYLEENAK